MRDGPRFSKFGATVVSHLSGAILPCYPSTWVLKAERRVDGRCMSHGHKAGVCVSALLQDNVGGGRTTHCQQIMAFGIKSEAQPLSVTCSAESQSGEDREPQRFIHMQSHVRPVQGFVHGEP